MSNYNLPPDLERILRDLSGRLGIVEVGGPRALVRVITTGTNTLTTGVTAAITFGTFNFDTVSMWNAGAPTRLTIKFDGAYLLTSKTLFQANGAGTVRRTAIRRTLAVGGTEDYATLGLAPAGAGELTELAPSDIIRCVVGDYLELTARQTSGGNLDILNPSALSAIYLGPV
jgi:hypothetical protein